MRPLPVPVFVHRLLLVICLIFLQLEQGANGQQQVGTSGLLLRLRANKLRRPEFCRDSLPRRGEDLPPLVITGRVREVYLAAPQVVENQQQPQQQQVDPMQNKALVNIGRVMKGNKQLEGADIMVSGFNGTSSATSGCPNYVKPNDTLILLLQPVPGAQQNTYAIHNNNLLAMNLNNLDRVNALANEEPLKRRGPIEDILCEARYCPYGRCQVDDEKAQITSCHCPASCPPLNVAPVCGSDGRDYASECKMEEMACANKKPIFKVRDGTCNSPQPTTTTS